LEKVFRNAQKLICEDPNPEVLSLAKYAVSELFPFAAANTLKLDCTVFIVYFTILLEAEAVSH
jgi:hypothetical protein